MSAGEKIKKYREMRGMSQGQLAEASDISQYYVSMCETGGRNPKMGILAKIADALDVPVAWLLGLVSKDEHGELIEREKLLDDIHGLWTEYDKNGFEYVSLDKVINTIMDAEEIEVY